MSAIGMASLGTQCANPAIGMASLGVFCGVVLKPRSVQLPQSGGYDIRQLDQDFLDLVQLIIMSGVLDE